LSPAQRELIELLRQKPDSPDAMRVDRLNLRFSAPVRHPDNDHLLGYVLLARDLGEIQLLFSGTPLLDGYAELQQEEGGHFVTLLKRGDEGLKAITPPRYTEISGTPWRLATWSAPPPGVCFPT
jgi:hypothetical protein